MNKAKRKSYSLQVYKDFIAIVAARAQLPCLPEKMALEDAVCQV